MKLAAMIFIALIAGAGARGDSDTGRQVTVYFQDRANVPIAFKTPARGLASQMFANIGVTLAWRSGAAPPLDTDAITIEFETDTPETFKPGALAYALPYEGVHIRVFWDRIGIRPAPRELLAHVMVHEIAHILQGCAQHSEDGIMKAYWTALDQSGMKVKPLHFTPADVDLIYEGMRERIARPPIAVNRQPVTDSR